MQLEANAQLLSKENHDLQSLLFNHAKCLFIKRGQGMPAMDFARGDPDLKRIFGYLAKMESSLGQTFFEERQRAEAKFDEAISGL